IKPLKPFCIEEFKEYPELGRFAMRDMGMTVAAGIVSEVTQKETSKK
ncbi:MAG: elongation factor 1-alpha, partial [Thaumarchaeota archaeon]|nr:elongation factor 1-alpha [Nitrososphaerota archaeon]